MKLRTIEELWSDYPLEFVEYRSEWGYDYTQEELRIFEYIEEEGIEGFIRIAHIGSTAVVGMKARPVIDILFEIKEDTDLERLILSFEELGYSMIDYPEGEEPNLMGYKGYDGGQVFHLYIRYMGKWDELYLRNHLNRNKESRKEYEEIKISLSKKYKNDRKKYLKEKEAVIKKYVESEKREYENYIKELDRGFESRD